jgi:hypothetical protein
LDRGSAAKRPEPLKSKDYFRYPRGTYFAQQKNAGNRKRNGEVDSRDREGRGGGAEDQWTEADFKQRVRERLDRIEQRLDRIEGRGEGPSGGRGGGGRGGGDRGGGGHGDRGGGRG